jgi:hypothetical protein
LPIPEFKRNSCPYTEENEGNFLKVPDKIPVRYCSVLPGLLLLFFVCGMKVVLVKAEILQWFHEIKGFPNFFVRIQGSNLINV